MIYKLWKPYLITALILLGILIASHFTFGATILQGYQGGTGLASTTVGNVGKCLQVNTNNPVTWTIATCGSGGGSGSFSASSTPAAILFFGLGANGTSSLNFTIVTSTVTANNLFNVIGTVSSTESRFTSSTIATLVDLSNNKYATSTPFNLSTGIDTQLLFGQLGGSATSSVNLTFTTSTGVFAISSSTIAGTLVVTGTSTFNGFVGMNTSNPKRQLDLSTAAGGMTFGDDVTVNSRRGIFWNADSATYGIFRPQGAWVLPYVPLNITWQTGIQLDPGNSATSSYVQIPQGGMNIGATSTPPANGLLVAGNVGIGTTTPTGVLEVVQDGGSLDNLRLTHYGTNTTILRGVRVRGTMSAPADVQNGDALFRFVGQGYSGGSYLGTAQFQMGVDGAFTSGQAPPTNFTILTNQANSSNVERMRIDSAGNVGIGTQSASSTLHVVSGGVGTTTLQLNGILNQTANLFTVVSSTNQQFFTISAMGLASSTEFRTPSSTIGTLFVTTCTGCGSGVQALPTSTAWVDGQVLFGIQGGFASSSALFSVSTSTGVFTVGSSSLANVSSTNFTAGTIQVTGQSTLASASSTNLFASGYLNVVSGRSDLQVVSSTSNMTVGGTFQANAGEFTFANASGTALTLTGQAALTTTTIGITTMPKNALFSVATTSIDSQIFTILSNGFVGIGTSTPNVPLNISRNDSQTTLASVNADLGIQNRNTTNNTAAVISFQSLDTNGVNWGGARFEGIFTSHAVGGQSAEFGVETRSGGGNLIPRFRVSDQGNFGFNTDRPSSTIDLFSLGIATTTFRVTGFTNQTGDLVQIVSSTKQKFFTISAMGVASSTEFRSPSSTITTLTVTSCTGCGGGTTGPFTSHSISLLPSNASLPDSGFAYPFRTVTSTRTFNTINFPPATTSDAFFGPFVIPANLQYNTTTIDILYTSTSTTAITTVSSTLQIFRDVNSSSSNVTFDNALGFGSVTNVSSSYATTTAQVVMGESISMSSTTFTTSTFPAYVMFDVRRPSTDNLTTDLELMAITIRFW